MVRALGRTAGFYKVGLELFASAGMDFARELKQQGYRVFLDLKLYDIGETVRRTVAQVAKAEGGSVLAENDPAGGARMSLFLPTVPAPKAGTPEGNGHP